MLALEIYRVKIRLAQILTHYLRPDSYKCMYNILRMSMAVIRSSNFDVGFKIQTSQK